MAAESRLVAEVVIDNGDAIPVTNATRDALVEAMAATERANQKIEKSEEEVTKALKSRLSASKEVDGAIRAQAAAGKPLEQELVQLSILYQKLEVAMRAAAKSGGGVPASLAQEAARVRARMGVVEAQISSSTQASGMSLGQLSSKVGGALSMFTAFGVGALTVGTSVRAMTGFMSSAVDEAANAEKVTVALNTALAAQGRLSDENRKRILDYSTALQRQTAFGDEQITQIQTQLIMRGKLEGEMLERATRNTLDMIAAGFGEEAAINAVAKAANGKLDTLNKLGIVVKATGDEARDFEKAMKLVEERFGGQAAAELETYEGKVKALENAWGDFKQELGEEVLPVLKDVFDGLREISNALTDDASEDGGMLFAVLNAQANLMGVNLGSLLSTYRNFKAELDEDPNVAMLREREEAWKSAEAALKKMEASSAYANIAGAVSIQKQKEKVDELYDAYTSLFMLQEEKGIGQFKGSKAPPPPPAEVDQKAEDKAAAERKRAIAEALDRVKRKQDEATKSATAYVDALIKEAEASNDNELAIVKLEQRNAALRLEIIAQLVANKGLNEEKQAEIDNNLDLIDSLEEEERARERATAAAEAQEKRLADKQIAETQRATEARAEMYADLGEGISSSMGTAFAEVWTAQKKGGEATRAVLRDVALAAINAAATEGAAKAIAAHSGIPFVGVGIGLAAAAAIVTAIFAQEKFLAMAAGGEPRGFGIPGVDSVPVMMRPDENVVDHTTNNRTKRMLDAFERGELTGGGRGDMQVSVVEQSFIPRSEAQFARIVKRQLVPVLKQMRESGEI